MYGRDSVMGSQAEWSDLLEHSSDLVQSVGSDGRLLYVNQGWLEALGYERDEVGDLTVFEIIHPACSSQCAAMMKAVSEGAGIENVETTLVAKSGQQIRVEGSIDCRFKDGVPAATRCIFRDISERKAAEEALRESELRLRTIMAAVQDGIVVLDAETHVVVEANDTAIEMYGGPREDIIGKSCYGAICPRREGECPITDEHRDLARSEAFLRKVSGAVVPVLKTAETVTLGGREHLVESFVEISELKAAEEALRESEQRLRTTIDEQELHARRLASLLESSRAIASANTMEEALAIVTRCAVELFELSGGIAYEYDPELDAIAARAMWERSPSGWNKLGEPLPLDEGSVEQGLLTSGGTRLERVSDPRLSPTSRTAMERGGRKIRLTVAMRSVDGQMGLLSLWDSTSERSFSEDELALANSLAEMAGEAVRSNKLVRRLRSLSETDSLTGLANHRKIHEILTLELARAQRYGSRFSMIMLDIDGFKLFNDTHGHLTGDAVLSQTADLLRKQTRAADFVGRYGGDEFLLILPETGTAGAGALAEKLRTVLAGAPHVTPGGEQIPLYASFGIAAFPEYGRVASELVAVADANLYASKRRGGDAVTGAEDGRSGQHDDGGAAFDLFESLVTAVDNKDRYTRRHSEEVTALALAMAEVLQLSEASQRVVRIAGLLHDVGKIGVPDRVLRKPGRLSEAEHEIIKGHPILGETIIVAIPDLADIRAAVVSHHERYDGGGYPHGLAGDDIPLAGRILAVADTYSAMTTDRPYRKALSRDEAIAEIRTCAGTQFDPDVVAAFMSIVGESAPAVASA